MENLRAWLLDRTDVELEELKGTSRFSTPHNKQLLNTIIYERKYGPIPDSIEDDAPFNNKYRSAAIQEAARALLVARAVDITQQVDIKALMPALIEQTGCHSDTAKRHIAKAVRRARGEMTAQWGGARPGPHPGRPKNKNE